MNGEMIINKRYTTMIEEL